MQINTNLYSLNAQRSYARSALDADVSVQRLSSGLRINSARDDAAGLAISERLAAGVTGLNRAAKNTNDAISLMQVADGALATVVDNFQRMRELAVQAANGSNNDSDRKALQQEVDALVASNTQIVTQTQFNHLSLLDGSFKSQFQIGANYGDSLALAIPAVLNQSGGGGVAAVDVPLRQVSLSTPVAGALGAGDLTLNGVAVGASVAGAGAGRGAASAYALAAAISAANIIGISASASNGLSGSVSADVPGGVSINGVALGAISGVDATTRAQSAAAAINGVAGTSGVTASASGATLTLSAGDGRDIDISDAGGGQAALLGLGLGPHHGTLNLSNTPAPGTNALIVGGGNPGAAGLTAGAQASALTGATASVLQSVGSGGEPAVDIGSFDGASSALGYLDAKIERANGVRALLGATENRLALVVTSAQQSASNLAAARSRIRDTDYASETAQFTRSQILMQAGMAMLAQANAQPERALALLR